MHRPSPAKKQNMLIICDEAAVSSGDIAGMLATLKTLSSDRATALSAEGCVSLLFHGYDNDPRELESIPEIRAWFAQLFEAWPYWSFFANRTDHTTSLLFTLLLPGEQQVASEPGITLWAFDPDRLEPLLVEMLGNQNALLERLEISDSVNRQASADFMEAVRAFVDT